MTIPDRVEWVVVPLDGSELSESALPVSVWLADRLGAGVHLLSAVETEDDAHDRSALLDKIDLPTVSRIEREVVVDRDPAGAIHTTLRRLGQALACMATRGRSRSAAIVGSVSTEVIKRGHDPLVLVGPVVDPRLRGTGVLLCVDEKPESRDLVPVAAKWADMVHEPLTVVTVAEPVPEPLYSGPVHRNFGPDGDVDAYLADVVRPLRTKGKEVKEVKTQAIYDPISPAEGVLTYLGDHPAATVVVGTHARTGLARLALGSVAAAIVHGSPAPVLAVPRR
jgi:nucleotide-binding universal stress UspA family protein